MLKRLSCQMLFNSSNYIIFTREGFGIYTIQLLHKYIHFFIVTPTLENESFFTRLISHCITNAIILPFNAV